MGLEREQSSVENMDDTADGLSHTKHPVLLEHNNEGCARRV